jgi:hypothetical protein
VRPTHLHLSCGDAPLAIRQIELCPFGLSEFARSDKYEGSQLEDISDDCVPLEAIDRAKKGAHGVPTPHKTTNNDTSKSSGYQQKSANDRAGENAIYGRRY